MGKSQRTMTTVTSMIIITIISVLITTSKCDSFQPLQDDKTCQDMTLSEYHQMNFNLCTGNEKGHCLMNEQSIPGFVCLQVEEIPKGHCPFYNSQTQRMERWPCDGEKCPDRTIHSTDAAPFDGCYVDDRHDELWWNDVSKRPKFEHDNFILIYQNGLFLKK